MHPSKLWHNSRFWTILFGVLVSLVAVALVWAVVSYEPTPPPVDVAPVPSATEPTPSPTPTPTPSPSATAKATPTPTLTATPTTDAVKLPPVCRKQTTEQFVPTSIQIVGQGRWPVMGLGREPDGSVEGQSLPMWQFGWDQAGPPPNYGRGSFYGVAHRLLNGPSLGNLMLRHLIPGDLVVLRGDDGEALCLEVNERFEVRVEDYPNDEVFNIDRKPQLYVFDVCSGERRGSWDWSHATLWYLSPVR